MTIPTVAVSVVLSAITAATSGVYSAIAVCAVSLALGPLLMGGVMQTVEFLLSLKTSKKHGRIDDYNKKFDGQTTTNERNTAYADIVDSYYDLATEFYEWGWGTSFHFADFRKHESFRQAILRHEYYLAGRLNVNKGAEILDCGCGIGGPARNIARFTGANVKAVTLNQFQVDRGNFHNRREGLFGQVESIQADFMKMPFKDGHFDGVYAIESTCHAPNRVEVYAEINRVMKPGTIFATYEWCVTDKYDPNNKEHVKIKEDIMSGDGLPDLVHTSVCTKAVKEAGFEVIEVRDCCEDGHLEGGQPWYVPLVPSWNPLKWPRFQFNPVMMHIMPLILRVLETFSIVPSGTCATQVMLQAGGRGLAKGGQSGIFTPAWLMVARKPLN